jgi:hypothetical protein
MIAIALACAAVAFMVSASAGLGGSLILVPTLSLLLGPKTGIAVSALLLGCHNVAKVIVYRRTLPLRSIIWVFLLTIAGAAIGARLLVAAPESWVMTAVLISFGVTFFFEWIGQTYLQRVAAPMLAFFAGATSGFSGTSGPLKGIALRNLRLDRLHLVGAASAVSLGGDAMKAAIFAEAALLDGTALVIALGALPLMPLAALAGRQFNRNIGERAYAMLFWLVMVGYTLRLVLP